MSAGGNLHALERERDCDQRGFRVDPSVQSAHLVDLSFPGEKECALRGRYRAGDSFRCVGRRPSVPRQLFPLVHDDRSLVDLAILGPQSMFLLGCRVDGVEVGPAEANSYAGRRVQRLARCCSSAGSPSFAHGRERVRRRGRNEQCQTVFSSAVDWIAGGERSGLKEKKSRPETRQQQHRYCIIFLVTTPATPNVRAREALGAGSH